MNDGAGNTLDGKEARQWAMLCHLSALVGLLANGIGFVLGPLFVWLFKREDDPLIDEAGKESLNFQLTMFLAIFACIPLLFVLIGIPLLFLVGLTMTINPIVAAIKTSNGERYRYPISIRFIS